MPPKELPAGTQDEESKETKPKKRSRLKFFIILLSILIIIGAFVGAGMYWVTMNPDGQAFLEKIMKSDKSSDAETQPAEKAESSAKEANASASKDAPEAQSGESVGKNNSKTPGALPRPVSLPQLTVNLADNRYLTIGMDVEFNTTEAAQTVKNENARVRDAIILLLSGKTVDKLRTAEGKVTLKNEVAGRLNQILGTAQVVRVYFTDFVIR